MAAAAHLLEVEALKVHFTLRATMPWQRAGTVKAVDGVSLFIDHGETVGLVGESGCGKTTVSRAVMRMLEPTAGCIRLEGEDISRLAGRQLQRLRSKFQIVFQDPANSLNPRMTVEQLLAEPLEVAQRPRRQISDRVSELLRVVGLGTHHRRRYPHEFSGGQKQRIGIARALALQPKLVVCDEPVSALDVSVQAQIINLLKDIQQEHGIGYLFVAHDLRVVRQISHRIAVMYLGRIVEQAPKGRLFRDPRHPYTRALLSAAPRVHSEARTARYVISGELPDPLDPPSGCHFRTRCPLVHPKCAEHQPHLREVAAGHFVACHLADGVPARGSSAEDRCFPVGS
jgi:oligopeptide transport system ATP-binding protein